MAVLFEIKHDSNSLLQWRAPGESESERSISFGSMLSTTPAEMVELWDPLRSRNAGVQDW